MRFLHALRCIVDGTTEYLDVEFAPEMWRLRGGGELPTGWRWDSECGPVPPPSPLPTPPPLPPPPRVVAGYTQLPDVHASNPTGSFSIFRRPDEGTALLGLFEIMCP